VDEEGHGPPYSDQDFADARERLVECGCKCGDTITVCGTLEMGDDEFVVADMTTCPHVGEEG
jgi:hypothetical protein